MYIYVYVCIYIYILYVRFWFPEYLSPLMMSANLIKTGAMTPSRFPHPGIPLGLTDHKWTDNKHQGLASESQHWTAGQLDQSVLPVIQIDNGWTT